VSYAWGTLPGLAVRRRSLRWRVRRSDLPQEALLIRWEHNPLQRFTVPGYRTEDSFNAELSANGFTILVSEMLPPDIRAKAYRALEAITPDLVACQRPIEISLRAQVFFITLVVPITTTEEAQAATAFCEALASRLLAG
jgi:hypothetical protein